MERKQVTEEIDEIVVNYKEIHQIVNAESHSARVRRLAPVPTCSSRRKTTVT